MRLDFRVWDSLLAVRCSNLAGLVGHGRKKLAVFRTCSWDNFAGPSGAAFTAVAWGLRVVFFSLFQGADQALLVP